MSRLLEMVDACNTSFGITQEIASLHRVNILSHHTTDNL